MLLLFALIAGSSSAWADDIASPWSHTFSTTEKTFTADGTETLSGVDWTLAVTWAGQSDYNKDSDKGMKIGSNSKVPNAMTLSTSGIPGTITKVAVTTCGRSKSECTVGVTVGGSNFVTTDAWGGSTLTEMTFNGSATGEIVITWTQGSSNRGAFYVSKIEVEFDNASTLETATWSVSPEAATIVLGQSTTLQLATNYDGTLNFESNDESIATVSYNPDKKEITVNGIAVGTTTISVTGAATSTYYGINKIIDVTVDFAQLDNNATDVMGPLGYSYFGLTPEGESAYVQPEVASTDKTDVYGVAISFAKAEGSYYPRFDEDHTRFYGNNTLTVTAPAGATLRKIVFTEPAKGKVWGGSMTPDQGSYEESAKTWFATTEDVTEVVFTDDGTKRIGGMEVYLMMNNATIAPAKEYTTYVTITALDFSGIEGLKAFVATAADDSGVTLEEPDGAVPAGTPLVLKKESGSSFTVPVVESAEAPAANLLVAGPATLAGDGTEYILSDGLFYKATAGDLATGRAYLKVTAELGRELVINWGGETAIQSIDNGQLTKDNVIYDLSGRRVENPTKGIFIINGKKVIIK